MACSFGFLLVLSEYTTNDHLWRGFNNTGGQTFLADVINTRLLLGQFGPFDIYDSFIAKDYSTSGSTIDMRPIAARQIMLAATSLESAISALRANSLYEHIFTIVGHCWVDFSRRFEMAHTAKRQLRCASRQIDNAAVYLEALLRNVDPLDLTQSAYGVQINQIVLTAVATTTGGSAWVTALKNHTWGPISDEVALWQQYNLTRYSIQFENRFQMGLLNSISIVNAFGTRRSMTTTSLTYVSRGLATWSTKYISSGFWNDMTKCVSLGCTLVRNMTNSMEAMGRNWDTVYTGTTVTIGGDLVRSFIGPLMNWDVYQVLPPGSLVKLFVMFQTELYQRLRQDESFSTSFQTIHESDVDVVPNDWRRSGLLYYGGNPLCAPLAPAKSFVQMSFNFDDACQTQNRFAMTFTQPGVLFAVWVSQMIDSDISLTCKLSVVSEKACYKTLLSALKPASKFSSPCNVQETSNAVKSTQLLFIQLATENTSKILLTQAILPHSKSPWTPLGWIALYDWVDGTREAYVFEGDNGNMTLLSARMNYLPMAAKRLELPESACRYVWYSACYLTSLSCVIILVLFTFSFLNRFQQDGGILFNFNRVVGSVWIGRPVLLVRGVTAAVVLSTSPAVLARTNVVTYFDHTPRPLLERLLLCGECLWVSYVIEDFLLPLLHYHSRTCTIFNSLTTFATIFCIETTAPIQIAATANQTCSITSFRRGATCISGQVEVGSFTRVLLLCGVQIACLFVSNLAMWIYLSNKSAPNNEQHLDHIIIPAAAKAFLTPAVHAAWPIDNITSVMSGFLPMKTHLFNFNLWTNVAVESQCTKMVSFTRITPHINVVGDSSFSLRNVILGYGSLLYMAMSIASSFAFLQLTSSAMSNDFWWESFDIPTQVFMTNWFNQGLQYLSSSPDIHITDFTHGIFVTTTNSTATSSQASILYSNSIQDEVNTVSNVIQSLRKMDGCQTPWIMTVYCYVDFKQKWEMAPTQKLQQYCQMDKNNGAIYLESLLRNADANALTKCWGSSLETSVFAYLRGSIEGIAWLSEAQQTNNSIADEITYWTTFNITRFSTQWQNYKSLGIAESFSIQNAFGLSYPLTLKYLNGSFQLPVQTSLKMQWPLAQTLTAILSNTSGIGGKSLIRTSQNFAFQNATPEDIVVATGYLIAPLGPGLSLVRSVLGPFGSVKMKRVSCPDQLRGLFQNLSFELTHALSSSHAIQSAFWPLYTSFSIAPRPRAWEGAILGGGNLLCDVETALIAGSLPGVFFSSTGSCGLNVQEFITNDLKAWMFGLMAAGHTNATALVEMETRNPASTKAILTSSVAFLNAYIPSNTLKILSNQAEITRASIQNATNVSLVQFLRRGAKLTLSILPLFSDTEPDFDFYAWLFLFDWVQGFREVVTFQGENGSITAISTISPLSDVQVNPTEVPTNVAYFVRMLMQYITCVLLCVACLVCAYILCLHGRVEALNMMSFSRIASLVWIGRPLIFVRAIAAICLLSTSTLSLVRPLDGLIQHLVVVPQEWYTIILAAGEVNWMVYIINDVFSIVTKQYTPRYAAMSFILVWLASGIMSFVDQPSAIVSLSRSCSVIEVDFQVECNSGVVAIGSFRHFIKLLCFVFGYCALCYLIARILRPREPQTKPRSLLLYAAARYQFRTDNWEHMGILYLDKASAVLTGLLSIESGGILYVFDIKTWRIHSCEIEQSSALPFHLDCALPLADDS